MIYWIGYMLLMFGLLGLFFNSSNLVLYFMSMELLLLGVNVLFILAGYIIGDLYGLVCALYILTISASEVSVGLGLLVSYYISQIDIGVNFLSLLSW